MVRKMLKSSGVQQRSLSAAHKLAANYHYFDAIDDEHKAYWLGFIYADGYVTNNTFGIKLQESDCGHLEKLKMDLQSDHKIGHYVSTSGYSNQSSYCMIGINDTHQVETLIAKGVSRRKSKIVDFPSEDIVPPHLVPHFIRGYFDGDGSVYGSVKSPCASFDGNELFLNTLLSILHPIVDTESKLYKDRSIYCIKLGGSRIIKKLYDYLYTDCTICLCRKRERFEAILNIKVDVQRL